MEWCLGGNAYSIRGHTIPGMEEQNDAINVAFNVPCTTGRKMSAFRPHFIARRARRFALFISAMLARDDDERE